MFVEYEQIKNYFDTLNDDVSHFANRNDICTPIDCVKTMIDSIPIDFWKQENIKILDPCCGNGNFGGYISTLTNLNNIYFNEISEKRIENLVHYFGEDINLTQKDFLKFDVSIDGTFNLIVANPPYAKFMDDGTRASKNHNLSRAFIEKALELTKDNGYILFIVPNNWMSFADRNNLPKFLTQQTILALDIHGAKKWFSNVGSSFTWFLVQKRPNDNKTFATIYNNYYLCDTQKALFIPESNFIPLYYSDTVRTILEKTINNDKLEKYKVETTSYLHKTTKKEHIVNTQDSTHPYRLIHTPTQTVWSDIPHKYQNGYKVFIPTTNQYKPFVDNDCGMTQSIAFIQCENKEEANNICAALNKPIYHFLNNITRYGNFNCNRVLERFPVDGTFTLTEKEQKLINDFNKAYPSTRDLFV